MRWKLDIYGTPIVIYEYHTVDHSREGTAYSIPVRTTGISSHNAHRSTFIPFHCSSIMEFLLDRLRKHAEQQPDKNVMSFVAPGVDGGKIQRSYTYKVLDDETNSVARRLLQLGLKPGDRYVSQHLLL